MGKSPSIQSLAAKDKAFQDYLDNLETTLAKKGDALTSTMQAKVTAFYTDNKYDDAKDIVSGQHYDFIHESEFSLAKLKSVVDAISKAIFAGGSAPSGANVDQDGTAAAAKDLGPEVGKMANLELYIAGKVFDVLSNVILSFGTTTAVTYNQDIQSKSLGYGMQMFTAVCVDSYKSTSFFNNEYINEYLYFYDVKFSVEQAKVEITQTLVELYEDQIVTYTQQEEDLLTQLGNGSLSAQAYTSAKEAFDTLIADTRKQVAELKTAALADTAR